MNQGPHPETSREIALAVESWLGASKRTNMNYIPEIENNPPPANRRFFTCTRHGWDCFGTPCPQCKAGDAPRVCGKHGWAHANKGCPKCGTFA
jgi:hypothetical protein